MIISLDPGTAEAGLAVYDDSELAAAWLSRVTTRGWLLIARQAYSDLLDRFPLSSLEGATVVIETPQIYHARSVGKDMIKLAQMGASFVTYLGSQVSVQVKEYLPRQWKGSVPKEEMVERIKQKLTPEEHSRIDLPRAKSLHHNLYDACGIGLKYLGRLS